MTEKKKKVTSDKNMSKRSGNKGQETKVRRTSDQKQHEAMRYAENQRRKEAKKYVNDKADKKSKRSEVKSKQNEELNVAVQNNAHKYYRSSRRKGNVKSRKVGYIMMGVQIIATVMFLLSLFLMNMLPEIYLVIIAGVLGLLVILVFATQFFSKKRGILGKLISVVLSIALFIGSFYVYKTTETVEQVSGGSKKLDEIIVAVPVDDEADSIRDAAEYVFGVQYHAKAGAMQETVAAINAELGTEIETLELSSAYEQASKLRSGEVQAIILDEAYLPLLDEQYEGFKDSIKTIYSYTIESEVQGLVLNQVKVEQEPFTVYISGIDVYGDITTNSRSDVNIMAVVNPNSHQILLITTPRDYYVEIPGISGGMCDKLTHAGIYGVDASMSTLEEIYDTEIDFYARVNFTSLIQMVDALGGVDVESEIEFTTSTAAGCVVDIQEGINHLNGEQALAFCRERKNLANGDNQRGMHQQAVITAMIQKAVSPAILMGANELLDSVSGNVDTNMSTEQIQALVKSQLSNPSRWMIKSVAATGTGSQQYCYSSGDVLLYVCLPDYSSVEEISRMIDAVEQGEIFEDSKIAQ